MKETGSTARESAAPAGFPWPAPAKLNLFLHILGRRPDGYHEVQTLYQFVEFGDTLFFDVRHDGVIRRHGTVPGIRGKDDLAVQAAKLLRSESGSRLGCDIHIEKRVPSGGGLGGGSSDAATTLVALNRLWGLDLPDDRLAELGLRLGADVPVFVRGHAAWAEGIGEKLTPVAPPEPWYLIVTPDCSVNTREVYQAVELPRTSGRVSYPDFESGRARNDFTPVVRTRYPPVGAALDWLAGFAPARLSGSGASVFAAFADRVEADRVRAQVPEPWRAVVTRGVNRSPLHRALERAASR